MIVNVPHAPYGAQSTYNGMPMNCAFSTIMSHLGGMYVMTNLRHHYGYRMTKNEYVSNRFEVTERKTLAVQNIVDKNKYLTILFFSQHYTQLDTCPTFHPYVYHK